MEIPADLMRGIVKRDVEPSGILPARREFVDETTGEVVAWVSKEVVSFAPVRGAEHVKKRLSAYHAGK